GRGTAPATANVTSTRVPSAVSRAGPCGTISPVPTDLARLHAVFDLAMRVGVGLLGNGAAASEVTATVLRITSSSGLRNVSVQVTFDEVIISYLADESATPFTRVRAASARTQNFARLAAFEDITHDYISGEIPLEQARRAAE